MEQNDAPCSNVLTVLWFGSNTNGNQPHLASVLRDLGSGRMGDFGCASSEPSPVLEHGHTPNPEESGNDHARISCLRQLMYSPSRINVSKQFRFGSWLGEEPVADE
jgi:hypothetical protein